MRNKKRFSGTVKIGEVGVDAGLIWIGDPCYIWEDDASAKEKIGKTWSAFCDSLPTDTYPIMKNYDGLGVVVTSGHGDGLYPVYATVENDVVKSVTIQFESDENDDEDEWSSDGDEEEPYDENV